MPNITEQILLSCPFSYKHTVEKLLKYQENSPEELNKHWYYKEKFDADHCWEVNFLIVLKK